MSILETVLIFVGIPVVVIAAVAALSFRSKPEPGTHPAHFNLGEPWTHAPVLWSATDEVTVGVGHHEGDHAAIEASSADLIGGRAHGRW